jgi:hypothetical protein
VDACFPLLKNDLSFYSTMPHAYFVRLALDRPGAWSFVHGYRRSASGTTEVTFVQDELWSVGFEKYGLLTCSSSSLDTVLDNRTSARPFAPGFRTTKVDQSLVVRSWVYDHIKEDMDALRRKR